MLHQPRSRTRLGRDAARAFTLLEILVVLAIIGLLVGVLVVNVGGNLEKGGAKAASIFVNGTLKTAMVSYRIDMGDYPTTAEGLQALVSAPAGKDGKWRGPYYSDTGTKIPDDAWGQPYVYRYPGTQNKNSYDVFSKGPDRTEGTPDDIGNW